MVSVLFVMAAATGTVGRWWVAGILNRPGRPFGTFTVNISSAFALGLLVASSADTVVIAGVGGLGSLSTFSTIMREVWSMIEARRRADAAAYLTSTVVVGVIAAWVGLSLG